MLNQGWRISAVNLNGTTARLNSYWLESKIIVGQF